MPSRMDEVLTVLFYVYAGLAVSAPLLAIPAILICRRLSIPPWKGAVVCIPWLGLPLFALMIRLPDHGNTPRPLDPR
jgi:hypothetical protein